MNCEFITGMKGDRCVRCGYQVKVTPKRPLSRECKSSCVHLGEPVGEILTDCETCQGRVRVKQVVHYCTAFGPCGRCLPAYIPPNQTAWEARKPESDIYHLCNGCQKFKPLSLPTS